MSRYVCLKAIFSRLMRGDEDFVEGGDEYDFACDVCILEG